MPRAARSCAQPLCCERCRGCRARCIAVTVCAALGTCARDALSGCVAAARGTPSGALNAAPLSAEANHG